MPWLFFRWILEDRMRPVAAESFVRTDTTVGRMRVLGGFGLIDAPPEDTPPPIVVVSRPRGA